MSSEVRELQSSAERLAGVIGRLTEGFTKELQAVLRESNKRLRRLVAAALDPQGTGKRTLRARIALATVRRDQVRAVLREAGLDDLMGTAVDRGLATVLHTQVARQVVKAASRGISVQLEALQALRDLQLEALLQEGEIVAARIFQAVLRGIVTDAPREAVLDGLDDDLGKHADDVRTLYDTSTSIFTRQAQALDAADDAAFIYTGPVDGRLRPFCYDHVGKVYTRAEIDQLDNGQLPNCFLTGGGYNCRHVWQELSSVSALREFTNTGTRVPEFETLIATMPPLPRKDRYGRAA